MSPLIYVPRSRLLRLCLPPHESCFHSVPFDSRRLIGGRGSLLSPGFNTVCAGGNQARWGFCNNIPSQDCQTSDDSDADGAIGLGLTGQDCCPIGAGYTSYFVSNGADAGNEARAQAWVLIRQSHSVGGASIPPPPMGGCKFEYTFASKVTPGAVRIAYADSLERWAAGLIVQYQDPISSEWVTYDTVTSIGNPGMTSHSPTPLNLPPFASHSAVDASIGRWRGL